MAQDMYSGPVTCDRVRALLPDLVAERLEEAQAERARQHLVECEECAEVLARLIADEVARAPGAFPPPPIIPPIELYEAFLRARRTRFGTLWTLVGRGLDAADAAVRDWAVAQRDTIAQRLAALAGPSPGPAGGAADAVRVRGAVRTRGAAGAGASGPERAPTSLVAEVVRSDSAPAGESVAFELAEPPHVTADGRFRLRMWTDTSGYAGQIALCTVDLGDGQRVSFTAPLAQRPSSGICNVEIDEAGVSARAGQIPLERVSLFVTRP